MHGWGRRDKRGTAIAGWEGEGVRTCVPGGEAIAQQLLVCAAKAVATQHVRVLQGAKGGWLGVGGLHAAAAVKSAHVFRCCACAAHPRP